MSMVDRIARAIAQRFNTEQMLYHGTSKDKDFAKFKDSRHGTWTTTDPQVASTYSIQNDSMGFRPSTERGARPWDLEPVNSASRVIPLVARPLNNPFTIADNVPDWVRNAQNYKKAQSDWFDQLRSQGHDGVLYPGGVRVDFNNANLRSPFAQFSDKNIDKSTILGGIGGAAAMGGLYAPDAYEGGL